MPRRPTPTRRWLTAATWPLGIVLTSWDYMWRSTPLHRRESVGSRSDTPDLPGYPAGISSEEVQAQELGHGPLFHRRYRTAIRGCAIGAEQLMSNLKTDLNQAAPTTFARFQKVYGAEGRLCVGDEYVVRMPGPWDGPVRVIDVSSLSFRLATLDGHLEAGQIEFRVRAGRSGELLFEIESWARSSSWFSNLLYHRLRMAKEIQAHMWISFLEGVVQLAGGRMTGGVDIATQRIEDAIGGEEAYEGPPRVRRRLAELSGKDLNFDPQALARATVSEGWRVTDLCQPLPSEPPGVPVEEGSWEIARRLMRGYEFADPSIVRAYYDPALPLAERNMLLKLQALGLVHLFAGVRVGEVYEQTRQLGGRQAQVWGWNYRTLEGHVEMGQMDWEIWKWLDRGEVEFRVHAVSRPAPIRNPFVRVGFRLLRERERQAFLESTKRRMQTFVSLALQHEGEGIRSAASELTARRWPDGDAAHDAVVRNLFAEPAMGTR